MYIVFARVCLCACVLVGVCLHMAIRFTPTEAEYLPAWQDVQVAATEEVDPTGPYSPAAHKEPEQVVAPVFDAYFPAPQGRQASSGRPYGLCLPLPLEVPAEQG